MDTKAIEAEVRRLQFEIWKDRDLIFPMGVPPVQAMFQPDVAARVLDLEFEYREQLGCYGVGSNRTEVAGMLDRRRGIIAVAARFPDESRRFTGAHEVGHAVLHPGELFHRDRPMINSDIASRPLQEREADYFAACFLAPKKLVEEEFVRRFGRSPIVLTNDVAFHLVGNLRQHELLTSKTGSLDFAVAVASACSFNGRRFQSLAKIFGVSISAMALRLQELNLVLY